MVSKYLIRDCLTLSEISGKYVILFLTGISVDEGVTVLDVEQYLRKDGAWQKHDLLFFVFNGIIEAVYSKKFLLSIERKHFQIQ